MKTARAYVDSTQRFGVFHCTVDDAEGERESVVESSDCVNTLCFFSIAWKRSSRITSSAFHLLL